MNATNRAANRLLLLITGLVLLAAGALAVLLGALPAAVTTWRGQWAAAAQGPAWITAPAVGAVSWLTVLVAAVAAVLAIALVVFIARQGHGRAAAVLERRTPPHGRTRVDLAVPRTLLTERLAEHPDVIASRVSAYDVRGTPTLKISVRARRGVSPTALADEVVEALRALDAVLGEQLPAYLQISGGFRTRTAARSRVA